MKYAILSTLLVLFLPMVQGQEEEFFGQLKTVVIDAGHGGDDPGCLGASSKEKDIALAIALKLGGYLEEKFDNLNVIYTRKTDVFVELDERARIANKNKADLFICIHANSAGPSAFGTETFVMGNAKSESNMKAAQRENAVILLEDNYQERYENFDPNSPESYIAMSMMQSAFQHQSMLFAGMVQDQFRERVGRKDRGVKMAPFLVLHQTTMPSVLIETGFVTNKSEEAFLLSEIGQDYLASAIYRAFRQYKDELESTSRQIVEDEDDVIAEAEGEKKRSTGDKNADENGTAKTIAPQDGLWFKVQLATTTSQIEPIPENFKGLKEIEFYEAGGLFRYTYGSARNWETAGKLQEKARQAGFDDAFVVAFMNGNRIAVGEAVKLLKRENP
jgi:N-acetylmuramoyl-L-alanine amidase